jgi:hypothetical protein
VIIAGLVANSASSGTVRPRAPLLVLAPLLRQAQPEIEQRVPAGGHVRHEHDGLAVLHLPGDPGVLAGHPHRGLAFLQLRGLVQHHDRSRNAQVRQDEPLQRLQRHRPVPGVLGQQGLHPPRRRGMPGYLPELPARPAFPRPGQQRADVRERQPRPGLREHARQQRKQLLPQFPQPCPVTYDGTGGHLVVHSCHKPCS